MIDTNFKGLRYLLPEVSDKWKVVGKLWCDSEHPELLSQDMIEIQPIDPADNRLIMAGWYPDEDPNGCYVCQAVNGLDELLPDVETKDPIKAIETIEQMSRTLSLIISRCANGYYILEGFDRDVELFLVNIGIKDTLRAKDADPDGPCKLSMRVDDKLKPKFMEEAKKHGYENL